MRDDQIRRQWSVWCCLAGSRRPLTVDEIRDRLSPLHECSTRTVRRDLDVLQAVGALEAPIRDGRLVRYVAMAQAPPLRLDADGLLALQLAIGVLSPFSSTPIGEQLGALLRQLQRRLPKPLLKHFAPLAQGLHVRVSSAVDYSSSAVALETIRNAISAERALALDYEAADGNASQRVVHPQALVYAPGRLYLLATDPSKSGQIRTFRLDRIKSAHVSPDPARRAVGFDAADYLAGSIGVHSAEHAPTGIRIRIHDRVIARSIAAAPWHSSQRLTDRGAHAELSLTLTSTRELISRLLALGPAAEVLAPPSLREEVADLLSRAATRYARLHQQHPAGVHPHGGGER